MLFVKALAFLGFLKLLAYALLALASGFTFDNVFLWTILGIAGRAVFPALVAILNDPNLKLDRKFLLPPIITFVIGLVLLPFVGEKIVPGLVWWSAFAVGWAVTDILRNIQKAATPSPQAPPPTTQ